MPGESSEGTIGVFAGGNSLFCLNTDCNFEVVRLIFSCNFLVGVHVI